MLDLEMLAFNPQTLGNFCMVLTNMLSEHGLGLRNTIRSSANIRWRNPSFLQCGWYWNV